MVENGLEWHLTAISGVTSSFVEIKELFYGRGSNALYQGQTLQAAENSLQRCNKADGGPFKPFFGLSGVHFHPRDVPHSSEA
jgi:hypothetical protein